MLKHIAKPDAFPSPPAKVDATVGSHSLAVLHTGPWLHNTSGRVLFTRYTWRWWMWMAAANFRLTHSPSRLAWDEGWRPLGDQAKFII